MNNKIYLDNNATTKVDEEVLNAMLPYFKEEYGNPSSIYNIGKRVKEVIEKSRTIISNFLNAKKEEIVFTSCASESNCTAIMSAVRNNPSKRHIITTKVEHSSILETMKYLESIGYKITYLSVDNNGRLNLEELKSSITSDTLLISVMLANNEIGNIYPIKEIGEIAHQNNILFHVDAVQAVGKIKIDVKELNADTLSMSGHKVHAPKGIGILYIKEGTPFVPLIFGHQEKDRRGGTENAPYIVGLGKAIELLSNNEEEINNIRSLRDYFESQIKGQISGVKIYGDIDSRLPNTTNIAFEGVKGDELLLMLEANNIYVSTGSACNSFDISPSYVLLAINAELNTSSPIRVSLGKYNNKEEIDIFIKRLVNAITMIRKR